MPAPGTTTTYKYHVKVTGEALAPHKAKVVLVTTATTYPTTRKTSSDAFGSRHCRLYEQPKVEVTEQVIPVFAEAGSCVISFDPHIGFIATIKTAVELDLTACLSLESQGPGLNFSELVIKLVEKEPIE